MGAGSEIQNVLIWVGAALGMAGTFGSFRVRAEMLTEGVSIPFHASGSAHGTWPIGKRLDAPQQARNFCIFPAMCPTERHQTGVFLVPFQCYISCFLVPFLLWVGSNSRNVWNVLGASGLELSC
jgi:hypothetical protein